MASTFISLPVAEVTVGSVQITDGVDNLAINPDGSINVVNSSGAIGTPVFLSDQSTTNVGTEETKISYTVTTSKTFNIEKIIVTCRQSVKFTVLVDGVVIGSGRTAPGAPNVNFDWAPNYPAQSGENILVKIIQARGQDSDVETYLMGVET